MAVPFREQFVVRRGFHPVMSRGIAQLPDSIIDGLNILSYNGVLRKFNQAGAVGGTASPIIMLVGNTIGGIGGGSVVYAAGEIWAVGTGTARGMGKTLGASENLSFTKSGAAGGVYAAGLTAPEPPVIADPLALDDDALRMFGVYSVQLTKKRSLTGHESNGSKSSNAVYNKATDGKYKKLRITVAGDGEDYDYHGLYVSFTNKGRIGAHYWYQDYPKGTTLIVLDINDTDLTTQLAPTNHFPPPPGTHVGNLGGVMAVFGAYGTGMAPSIPGLMESYDPLFVSFFPEPIVGTKGRATDGWLYVMCQNSLNAAILTGSTSTPMLPRTLWAESGFAHAGAACLVGAQLYGFNGKPVRTVGDSIEPDSSFAEDVIEWMNDPTHGFTAGNTVVGYDPANQLVVFAAGSRAIAYHIPSQEWSTEINLGSAVVSAATASQVLHFSTGSSLVQFDRGAAQSWYFITNWKDGGYPYIYKLIKKTQASGESGNDVALLVNMNTSPVAMSAAAASLGLTGGGEDRVDMYYRGVKELAFKVSGNGGTNPAVDDIVVTGLAYPKVGR